MDNENIKIESRAKDCKLCLYNPGSDSGAVSLSLLKNFGPVVAIGGSIIITQKRPLRQYLKKKKIFQKLSLKKENLFYFTWQKFLLFFLPYKINEMLKYLAVNVV